MGKVQDTTCDISIQRVEKPKAWWNVIVLEEEPDVEEEEHHHDRNQTRNVVPLSHMSLEDLAYLLIARGTNVGSALLREKQAKEMHFERV